VEKVNTFRNLISCWLYKTFHSHDKIVMPWASEHAEMLSDIFFQTVNCCSTHILLMHTTQKGLKQRCYFWSVMGVMSSRHLILLVV
jgi:hypothetical protein